MLTLLLEAVNEVVTKEYLLDAVWPDVETTEQSLTVAVSKLRKAFGAPRDAVIINVAGVGYRIATSVVCELRREPLAPFALRPGDVLTQRPHWRAVRSLSANELSPVWLVEHEKTSEKRVFKFATDGVHLRALQREVAVFRLLKKSLGEASRFAVQLFEWNFEESPFFVESEYCGVNLLEWSKQPAFIAASEEARLCIAAAIATAVASAHSVGVFHNDLKPTNILLMKQDRAEPQTGQPDIEVVAEWKVKVADFGVASLQNLDLLRELEISYLGSPEGESRASSLSPFGTAIYRAPELLQGGIPNALSDTYSLGVLLYQIATGNFFEPPSPGWEDKVRAPLLRRDIADAASLDPVRRIQTVSELAKRLQSYPARLEQEVLLNEREKAAKAALRSLERTRVRRPWVALTMGLLCGCLLVALGSIQRAIHNRDAERRQNATLQAMYDFLSVDLLGQSNPYLGVAGSGAAPAQTLLSAIATATPRIDERFAGQPEIAGQLHETVGDSLKSRTQFPAADQQYAQAADDFRRVEGPHSERAILVELKREFAQISSILPGALEAATRGFAQQQALLKEIAQPSMDVQAWAVLVQSSLLGMHGDPARALALTRATVERVQSTPSFDPGLLIRLKNQMCGSYVRLGDGQGLERQSKEIIALLRQQHGPESALLFPYQMYMEEAYYLEGKYPETVTQADENLASFDRVLGRKHQLTLATLATRAAAEARMERYGDAIRDSLALNRAEHELPSGRRMEVGSLNDAAVFECRAGNLEAGIRDAREVMREAALAPPQPMFLNGSMFTTAECLLAEEELAQPHAHRDKIQDIQALLDKVDVRQMAETVDGLEYEAAREVAVARLALLRGEPDVARRAAAAAQPILLRPDADPFERLKLTRVKRTLDQLQRSSGVVMPANLK